MNLQRKIIKNKKGKSHIKIDNRLEILMSHLSSVLFCFYGTFFLPKSQLNDVKVFHRKNVIFGHFYDFSTWASITAIYCDRKHKWKLLDGVVDNKRWAYLLVIRTFAKSAQYNEHIIIITITFITTYVDGIKCNALSQT